MLQGTQQTTELKSSNDLRFNTQKNIGKNVIYVKIRLNDECKNGHQDFSITGDIYEAGKPKTDRYFISGGCIHDEIEKYFPEFIPFIKLHLCDYKGIPMHASANGFYHLRNGFNKTKPDNKAFKAEYCKYYRINEGQFDALNSCENELQFSVMLQTLGILKQWEMEANKAIETLEMLTDTKFIVDSKRTQYIAPTADQLADEKHKQETGYYTPEAKQAREAAKFGKLLGKLEAERDKEINKATLEFEAKKQVLIHGGEIALNNVIFYTHTNTLTFNWHSYDNLPVETIDKIISSMQLPEGVTVSIGK